MPDTPTLWLAPQNISDFPTADVDDPKILGLSNGNILVVWAEDDDTVSPAPDEDIVGMIYDAQGNAVSGLLFLTTGVAASGIENYASIAATDDGGFVMAFDHRFNNDNDLLFVRYDENGTRTQASYIENDANDPDVRFDDPHIVARNDGTFFVTYESDLEGGSVNDDSILGRIIAADGTVGPAIVVEADPDTTSSAGALDDPISATLTNGVVVTVFEEPDQATEIGMSSLNTDGTTGFDGYGATFSDQDERFEPDIAALTGGGFVVVYTYGIGDIEAVIWGADAIGVGTEVTVAVGSNSQNEPTVVGLPDGGFMVFWDNDTNANLEGQRFDAVGNTVGGLVSIAGTEPTNLDASMTNDGRILVTYENLHINTVEMAIFDPRDDSFTLDSGGGQATTRIEGGTVFATAGDDIIFGQGGRDTIYGLNGEDTLYGGGNRDYLGGSGGDDTMFGGQGNDVFVVGGVGDVVTEYAGQGEDTVRSSITYTLDIELEHLNLLGNANIQGYGNNKDNILQGNEGKNVMFGFKGDDLIKGFGGRDGLVGNDGADRLFGMQGNDILRGDLGADELYGGAGNDRFVFRAVTDSKVNASQRDTIKDFTRGADKIDLRQIDASNDFAGDQAFQFIGGAGFSVGVDIGQVRFNAHSAGVMVAIDTDGNGSGDMLILVESVDALSASDFLL